MRARTGFLMTAATTGVLSSVLASVMLAQVTGGQARAAQSQAAQARPAAAAPTSSAAPAPQAATAAAPRPATGSSAAPARRDPFRPLISLKKPNEQLPARLPAGKPGLVIGQLTIQGIVRNLDGKWMAVVDNKTKRSYFLYERDELYNGVVTSVTPDSVTFEERSIDGAGRTRTREVVKRMSGT